MSAPGLVLVVIARDEATRLGRLLDSASAWVDDVLVLDTGSSDGTPELARAAGARVAHFSWCDDFSAARNAALDRAGGRWHLVLDADEWLAEGGPALRQAAALEPDFVGAVHLTNSFGPDAASRSSEWLSRLLPGSVRYVGRIHEQPQHRLPVRRLDVHIGHDGYAPEALQAKRGRNRLLLEEGVRQSPQDAYLWYQLGKDAAVYEEHAAAEAAFERAWELARGAEPWLLDLAPRRIFGLKCLRLHEQGLAFAQAASATCAHSPDFHFAVGDLLLGWTETAPHRFADLLAGAEQAWRRCLEIGERPDLPGAVLGRGSKLAAHNLALVLEGTGRGNEARALRAARG
ncbi:MAG: glycosyltransferase family 2 protein [Rubrivivax sp.]